MPEQIPLPIAFHANRQLFSDYYLNTVLPARPEWRAHIEPLLALRDQVANVLASAPPTMNEAQTEEYVVKPILALLGHTFEIQAGLRTPFGLKRPDYVLYRDDARRLALVGQELNTTVLRDKIVAVGDAKRWGRPLDVALDESIETTGQVSDNPVVQITFYMRHSGATWGILTNGRLWRLYHADTAYLLDRHYEVDLPAILAAPPEAFAYFVGFFHRSAFDDHPLGLAAILTESAQRARGISDRLKQQVYTALRHLAQGFLDYAPNKLDPEPATLKTIYDHCLIILYRLLFVFYAEARDLLPLRENETYRTTYSLAALITTVRQQQVRLAGTARLWPQLRDLFQIINDGSPPLQVATFNGGLFDPARYPFLEQHTVGDARLQAALLQLAVVEGQLVDYRDLGERHLGTIYEGLLEHHIQPIPREGEWSIDLFNDRGERHRTGSFYTPDFVVSYIVEQTLRPALDDVVAGKETEEEQIAAILAVNCLDPSMGSGHFPVAAMEFIARYIVDRGLRPLDNAGGETDLTYWKRRVAQSCIYGVDINPLAVDLAKLSLWLATAAKGRPLSFLDHHLRCGNALIGASIATLDVRGGLAPTRAAQAKAAQAARQRAAAQAAGQISMLDNPDFARSLGLAVADLAAIEASPALRVEDVKRQEVQYAALRERLNAKYEQAANLSLATRFGVPIDGSLWPALIDYATGRTVVGAQQFVGWIAAAKKLAAEQRWFHFDLEFPEVFFDDAGHSLGSASGFTVVLGNPPYVRSEQLGAVKDYFQQAFSETYSGTADLFVYFFQQGIRLLQEGGRLGYIASNSWLRANYATPLRAFLRSSVTVEQLIDLGDNRVFADAPDVYPAIPVVRKMAPPSDHTAAVAVFTRGEGIRAFAEQVATKRVLVSIHDQQDSGWQLGGDAARQVFAKLMARGRPLGQVLNGTLYRGILTGLNDAFIVDQQTRDQIVAADPACADMLKPLRRGEDLNPWYQEEQGRWLIVIPARSTSSAFGNGMKETDAWERFSGRYPAIAAHLGPFADAARKRLDKGEFWWELRSCDYYPAFDQRKIFWPDIAKFPRFSWDDTGAYSNDKGFFAVTDSPYILGILQSRAIWLCIANLCVPLGERAGTVRYQQKIQFISRLPIPDAPEPERQAIGELALKITEAARARYALHRRSWRRLLTDLGTPGKGLNQRLTTWWDLDFAGFRDEIRKIFKCEIALKDRDDWEEWLDSRRQEHLRLTGVIVAGEIELNARVFQLFGLTADEIKLVDESTKYRYGEV